MPLARVNGVDLFWTEAGAGVPVLFAHGGEGTHLHWWQQMAALSARHRCIAYDARGFGLSGGGWGDPDETAASDLIGLMDALGIERAFLVGQSMGGIAVSGAALRAPERVLGIVMSDTPFGFQTPALSAWAAEMLDRIPSGFNVFDHLVAPCFARRDPARHFLYHAICQLNSARPLPDNTDDYRQGYVRMRDAPPGDYRGFPVPSLFLVGARDALTPPDLMRATADAVGGSRFVTIPDAGHSAFFEQPDFYNAALMEFFDLTPRENA